MLIYFPIPIGGEMMRSGLAALAALVLLAAPAAAQTSESARMDRTVAETGRWRELLGEAMVMGSHGLRALNQQMQSLIRTSLTPKAAAAAAPLLRQLVENARAEVRKSEAMIDALPPFPAEVPMDIPPRQLIADAHAQNAGYLRFLDDIDAFVAAMAKGDMPAIQRAAPHVMNGAFSLIGGQRLLIRNRLALISKDETTHQSLAIAGQLYRAMEALIRGWTAARNGPSEAGKAAAALREELRGVATESRALAAAGRRNLQAELREVEDFRKVAKDPDDIRMIERVAGATAAEEKVFALGDRLAALAEANAGMTGAKLAAPGLPALLRELSDIEALYMQISQEQAALLAHERR